MKQEHRFVAQLFGYLAPFVDESRQLFLSLDGEAAKKGVREKHFQDSIVPDVWLTLLDGRALRLEAKIMSWPHGFSVGSAQHKAWFGAGDGAHKPTGWVVAGEALEDFYYWPHESIATQPAKPTNRKGEYYAIRAPTMTPMFRSVRTLALHILSAATGAHGHGASVAVERET
jgi:hypothetical protein